MSIILCYCGRRRRCERARIERCPDCQDVIDLDSKYAPTSAPYRLGRLALMPADTGRHRAVARRGWIVVVAVLIALAPLVGLGAEELGYVTVSVAAFVVFVVCMAVVLLLAGWE